MYNIPLQAGLTQNCSLRMFFGKEMCSEWAITQAVALHIWCVAAEKKREITTAFYYQCGASVSKC